MVKAYLSVFVNSMIENPAFDSQTKETLTLRPSSFGSKCDLPEKFIKQVADAGVAERVLSFATFKQDRALKKTDGAKRARIVGLPKLMDANDAGGRHSEDCTLILTEGDSAKSLVVGGLSVAGRDRFGVFPLRGKLLNVRDASAAAVAGNAEIQNIKQILGLQHGKVYENAKALRYGHLMIMTDQDHDGSHIKGLIMNFFHHFYPSLLKVPGFLLEFITPIVKATKGTRVRERLLFLSFCFVSRGGRRGRKETHLSFFFLLRFLLLFQLNKTKKNRNSPSTPCRSTRPGGKSAAGPLDGRSSTTKVG